MNLQEAKRAFMRAGWRLTHSSKARSRMSSYHFERNGVQVRISDHDLGHTAYGERQGLWLDRNFNVRELSDDLAPSDLIKHISDDDACELMCSGYAPSDDEWNLP